jgi:hypothetical protein
VRLGRHEHLVAHRKPENTAAASEIRIAAVGAKLCQNAAIPPRLVRFARLGHRDAIMTVLARPDEALGAYLTRCLTDIVRILFFGFFGYPLSL